MDTGLLVLYFNVHTLWYKSVEGKHSLWLSLCNTDHEHTEDAATRSSGRQVIGHLFIMVLHPLHGIEF